MLRIWDGSRAGFDIDDPIEDVFKWEKNESETQATRQPASLTGGKLHTSVLNVSPFGFMGLRQTELCEAFPKSVSDQNGMPFISIYTYRSTWDLSSQG